MKKFFKEFKAFALRGNVVDLAVGVIIGAAFQSIVTSLTDNILSPLIGIFVGQNFNDLSVEIAGATLYYGAFITAIINFIITAFIVFLLVKGFNRLSRLGSHGKQAPEKRTCPYCMTEVPATASRCPACTTLLEPVVKGAPVPPAEPVALEK